ncbi:DUF2752 domain-containing protein [Mucilaginibacter sp. Bleaf8]|uniref:DUF2752 domain-containing protein n=1 Tax=Mucilaginibacter sp. Bleaf8 TaxID=2834430 RepID=UPI001BD0CFF3|nr:DUF2752 domain-containing protein [Mucilaginibacter sp. Bleaf8]MBS7566082.1 DUF2752 domain-containing protein [Mucilaginibacter sp. Bleaf8]
MKYKKLYFTAGCVLVLCFIGIYFTYNPTKYSFFPKCPFHYLTGLDCPGCGSQRAIHALLHANLADAIRQNLLLVLSLPILLIHFGYVLTSALKGKKYKWALLYHPLTPRIMAVIVIAFWIVRNTPYYPFKH